MVKQKTSQPVDILWTVIPKRSISLLIYTRPEQPSRKDAVFPIRRIRVLNGSHSLMLWPISRAILRLNATLDNEVQLNSAL
jgi:hypothetical protein